MNDTREILTQTQVQNEVKTNITYRRFSNITSKPISWLWPGMIAKGKVTIISGDPGLGKSQMTASFAAITTTGSAWPNSSTRGDTANVIFLSAEDDPEDTIRPRLEAAGADLKHVFTLESVRDPCTDTPRTFNLSKDLSKLKALTDKINNVGLIIIDPITAYLGKADSHKTADIRGLLAPLSKFATDHNIAIVCISHLNKNTQQKAIDRTTGSGAFIAACRAAYIVCKNPENEQQRLFLPIKNNLGDDQNGLSFEIESVTLDNGIKTSKIKWIESTVSITADEAISNQTINDDKSALDEAQDFLCEMLREEPIPSSKLKQLAETSGLSWRTIQRAKKKLGCIEARKIGKESWCWALIT